MLKKERSKERNNVTIKDVAEDAGVSTATVSRVLNKSPLVTEDLIERVQKSIAKLGYRPNAAARALKTKETRAIGILVPDIANPYFMHIIKGIEDVISPLEYSLLMASSDEDPMKEQRLLNVLAEDRIDCLVLATAGSNEEVIEAVHFGGLPIVLVDRLPEELADSMDAVVEDNYGAAYELTQRVLEQGVHSLAVIHGPQTASTAQQRAAGVRAAIRDTAPRVAVTEYYGDFYFNSGLRAARRFLEKGCPEALLAMNNLMAMGALSELLKRGCKIGTDLVFGSYGAVDTLMLPGTTIYYVNQSPRALGASVGKLVKRRLHDPEADVVYDVVKQPVLVQRL
jgi:LacI family transcriptional regulator